MSALWNKITIKLILCYNLYAFCYSISSKLKCNFIKMRLRGKCFPVNLLHIFRTPSWARFLLEWMSMLFHLTGLTLFSAKARFFSIHFHKILILSNTMICSLECVAHSIRPRLEYRTSSILLCLQGSYCLYRVCTQKIFSRFAMLSRLASCIITFLSIFKLTLFLFCKNVFFYFCKSLSFLKYLVKVMKFRILLLNLEIWDIWKHSSIKPFYSSKSVKVFITFIGDAFSFLRTLKSL